MMVDVDDVIQFQGLRPQDLRFDKNDDGKLESLITKWIKQAESLIKTYCNNNFDREVPPAVENVCLRIVSNMITLAIQRRDSPLIKHNDWTISTGSSQIFTESEKEDLKPFKIEKSYTKDVVSFYAITGDDPHGKSHRHR